MNNHIFSNMMGFPMYQAGSASNSSFWMSDANTWIAFPFVAMGSKTLDNIRFRLETFGGTFTGTVRADVFSMVSGRPGSSLANASSVGSFANGSWCDISGLNFAQTDLTPYFIVLRRATADDVFARICGWDKFTPMDIGKEKWMFTIQSTTNAGSSWSEKDFGSVFSSIRLGYGDGSYDGCPYLTISASDHVYGTREAGIKFTALADFDINVGAISFPPAVNGTPGSLIYKIYNNTSLVSGGTSGIIPVGSMNPSIWMPSYYSTPPVILAGSTVRIVMAQSAAGGDSSNYYSLSKIFTDSNANSRAQQPFGGLSYTYFDGSSWTDDSSYVCPFVIHPDPTTPFTASGGGGGGMGVNQGIQSLGTGVAA